MIPFKAKATSVSLKERQKAAKSAFGQTYNHKLAQLW